MPSEFQEYIYDEDWNLVGIKRWFPNGDSEPEPPPEPVADKIPMFEPGDIQVFMATNDYEDVTDRFEHISGMVYGNQFYFRIRTLADKMSAREGLLMVVSNKLPPEEWGGVLGMPRGTASILAPRRPAWRQRPLWPKWHEGPDGRYAVIFDYNVDGEFIEMKGFAESSSDVPWNWHYGFEIQGSIPLIP